MVESLSVGVKSISNAQIEQAKVWADRPVFKDPIAAAMANAEGGRPKIQRRIGTEFSEDFCRSARKLK
jgi:hypothetical protein